MKRILIAPLDWGLGHATRCIPIIRYLLEKECAVVIGADGRSLQLLRKEFPALDFVAMPGYDISYPENGSMVFKIAGQIPKILLRVKREHDLLNKIIKEKNIDAVISDNRFGLWTKQVPCVFITHQLMIKSPIAEVLIHKLNKKYISKYTECWVPDITAIPASLSRGGIYSLSGDLAHKFPLPQNAKYVGVLSRFIHRPFDFAQRDKIGSQILIILSGPEPQRTTLEKIILKQLDVGCFVLNGGQSVLIVQGITEKRDRVKISDNVTMVSHLTSEELHREIIASEIIISRPGYSTVMDLAVMCKKAIFIPTPGQTEQKYLAKYYLEKKIAYSVSQKNFDLEVALGESDKYFGFTNKYSGEEFKIAADAFLAKILEAKSKRYFL